MPLQEELVIMEVLVFVPAFGPDDRPCLVQVPREVLGAVLLAVLYGKLDLQATIIVDSASARNLEGHSIMHARSCEELGIRRDSMYPKRHHEL